MQVSQNLFMISCPPPPPRGQLEASDMFKLIHSPIKRFSLLWLGRRALK